METYSARIEDIRIDYKLDSSLDKVTGTISVTLDDTIAAKDAIGKLSFSAAHENDIIFETTTSRSSHKFEISNPRLWWPHGYGSQSLYDFNVKVFGMDGSEIASSSKKIGFRQADLIQEPDSIGKSFYFRINGVDVFCGGSDWIPADNFTPRVTEDKYRKWLELMVDGFQVMIR